ncbi:MAG: transketolase C-terminal domain-containing protein [Acidobacteriota bacterium]
MRNAFAEEIARLAAEDSRVVVLSGDIGNRLFRGFKSVAGGRFLNCGVAEANMMGVAAGMALSGLRPFVYTIAPFATTRCLEQIRIDVCYHRAPVTIVGTGSGLSYAELGPTHHSCEDLAILRALPDMTVVAPGDAIELRCAVRAALRHDGPIYIRIGKKGEPDVHRTEPELRFGKAIRIREGRDACILSTGTMLPVAVGAAELLAAEGLSVGVESFHTIKPLDEERLEGLGRTCRLLVTLEEHSRIGGLGGAVSEWLAGAGREVEAKLVICGVDDAFMLEIGTQDYARRKFGLTPEAVAAKLRTGLGARRAM